MSSTDDITILKIGGSVITDKNSEDGLAWEEEIVRIAREISGFEGKLIIVHGAGSFGHPQAKRYSLTEGFHAEGAVVTHKAVKSLNRIVVDILDDEGVNAIAVHPMGCTVAKAGRISEMYLGSIRLMLEKGLVPVLHGDVVMDTEKGVSIVSGDQVIPYLATTLGASRIGVGSAANGVLDDNGNTIPFITSDNFEEVKGYIGGSAGTDVTGGMLGKVLEMLELGKASSITSYIFNATVAGNVSSFLNGENIGTAIKDS
ncbi:isopentenyl phosphate kinase [Methanococcoides methylutens]|uniref:isopentenyl phosphate kinase n=1 Tax=Methanococcoides methylutens TaxID=2226 RepID=UPI004043BF5C